MSDAATAPRPASPAIRATSSRRSSCSQRRERPVASSAASCVWSRAARGLSGVRRAPSACRSTSTAWRAAAAARTIRTSSRRRARTRSSRPTSSSSSARRSTSASATGATRTSIPTAKLIQVDLDGARARPQPRRRRRHRRRHRPGDGAAHRGARRPTASAPAMVRAVARRAARAREARSGEQMQPQLESDAVPDQPAARLRRDRRLARRRTRSSSATAATSSATAASVLRVHAASATGSTPVRSARSASARATPWPPSSRARRATVIIIYGDGSFGLHAMEFEAWSARRSTSSASSATTPAWTQIRRGQVQIYGEERTPATQARRTRATTRSSRRSAGTASTSSGRRRSARRSSARSAAGKPALVNVKIGAQRLPQGRDLGLRLRRWPRDRTAALIVIGNEILSGKVTDTNSPFLARELRALGVDAAAHPRHPRRARRRSPTTVREFSRSYDVVFTSGGVGPTHDDVTIEGIARGLGRARRSAIPTIESKLREFFGEQVNEARLKMAEVPEGAELHRRRHASASRPSSARTSTSCPGIPEIFEQKFETLSERFAADPYYLRVVYTREGEGAIAEHLNATLAAVPGAAARLLPESSAPGVPREADARIEGPRLRRARDGDVVGTAARRRGGPDRVSGEVPCVQWRWE